MNNKRKYHINDYSEYKALRDEMLTRLNFIKSYSNKTLTVIIALWAVGFTLVGVRFGIYSVSGYYVNRAFTFAESIAFFMVIPIVHSIVNKHDENIRQIASIGAYLRVFYECIPMLNQEESCFYWENVDASLNLVKVATDGNKGSKIIKYVYQRLHFDSFIDFYNWEYLYMALASVVFWFISIISFFSIDGPWFAFLPIVSCIAYLCCLIQIICSLLVIFTQINTPKRFNGYYKQSVLKCIENAKELGFIDDADKTKINEMIYGVRARRKQPHIDQKRREQRGSDGVRARRKQPHIDQQK